MVAAPPNAPAAAAGGVAMEARAVAEAEPLETPRLPVLLIPGFMCSGLEVEESSLCPHWKDQRIWLHLPKLGFQAMHMKGLWSDEEGKSLKNRWLQHLMLASPTEETEGIRLRAVEGLPGVDFLDPDSLFGLVAESTYVFAPVIRALEGMGYTRGEDLDAASYDFRLAPRVLHERDGYFDRLKDHIERMDRLNTGVVLVAHSMGNKVAMYFFEHARRSFGQEWLDRHVHLYVAAGAPLIGAPAAARATLLGDRMGLEAFLTMPEATLMARSFSSSPWLFPIGERADKTFYLRRQSLLEVRDFVACLQGLGVESNNNSIVLTVEIDMGPGFSAESLNTKSSVTFEDGTATFDPGSNLMFFGSPAELPEDASIRVIVKERGLHDASGLNPLKRLSKGVVAAVQLAREAAHGRGGRGVPKASTTVRRLKELLRAEPDAEGFVHASLQLARLHAFGPQTATKGSGWLNGCVNFRARWRDPQTLRLAWLGSQGLDQLAPVDGATEGGFQLRHSLRSKAAYDSVSHLELLRMVGSATSAGVKCPDVMKAWRTYYERDIMYNHKGVDDCPPVRSMLAVHGVNVPTEVGYALRINTVRAEPSMFHTRFVLDDEAELVAPKQGIEMKDGIISEVAGGAIPSGDGTVPLHSLEHSEAWRGKLKLKSVRLESVAHRDMLADAQFHEVLHDVLFPKRGFLDRWQSSTNGHEWFDIPATASLQLEAAWTAGKDSIELSINRYTYRVDLKALVQRNTSTGRERQVRRLLVPAGELCEASELVLTPYRGWPDGGFQREAVVADRCSKAEACSCARRAVREDPANCVAEVAFHMSLTGGHWLAKAFTSGPEQCMTFTRGRGRGYMIYSSEARSKPPAS